MDGLSSQVKSGWTALVGPVVGEASQPCCVPSLLLLDMSRYLHKQLRAVTYTLSCALRVFSQIPCRRDRHLDSS